MRNREANSASLDINSGSRCTPTYSRQQRQYRYARYCESATGVNRAWQVYHCYIKHTWEDL